MIGALRLATRYVVFHRGKSATLILCLVLTAYLPLAIGWLTSQFQTEMLARASSTPMLVGAKGSRYDLVLHALYFEGEPPEACPMKEVDRISTSGLAKAIPILARQRAGGRPVVGTTLAYFDFRGLRIQSGSMLARLGDCVLGATAADTLGLQPGDEIFTDDVDVFNIAGEYPLKMRVRGVLERAFTPDDDAVFVDLKTSWVIEGIGHGHQDVAEVDKSVLLESKDGRAVASAALPNYTEITEDNIHTFHFHGDAGEFPTTGIIVLPVDEKSKSLLMGRYLGSDERVQVVRPLEIVEELLRLVAKVKQFFDAQSILVAMATILLLGLVFLLGMRLRQREMRTMFRIGCSRGVLFWLFAWEWLILASIAAAIVAILIVLTTAYAPQWIRMLLF